MCLKCSARNEAALSGKSHSHCDLIFQMGMLEYQKYTKTIAKILRTHKVKCHDSFSKDFSTSQKFQIISFHLTPMNGPNVQNRPI